MLLGFRPVTQEPRHDDRATGRPDAGAGGSATREPQPEPSRQLVVRLIRENLRQPAAQCSTPRPSGMEITDEG